MESNEYGNAAAGHAMRESGSFRSRLEQAGGRVLAGGTRLGEFEIVGLIDESEVGITYLAYDQATRGDVTVWEYMPASLASRGRSGHVDRGLVDVEAHHLGVRVGTGQRDA